ncbi:MAG: ROK family protein, partial [Nitrosomonas sp.]|nr:ROK family protein [Nitrosomonas sp.]
MNTVLAVDVGGTNIRLAIVSDKGEILKAVSMPARLSKQDISAEELLSTLASAFLGFLDNKTNVAAIGIGFPGFFIGNSGVLSSSPNLPLLKEINLSKALSNTLGLPVVVQNDALCATIGEHRFGAGMGRSNMIHITLGTGVGAGLILNNLPYTGEGGM